MNEAEEKYTGKFSIPPFEPSDEDISLDDCIDVDKYVMLLEEINDSFKKGEIASNEAKFLKLCATRWIKFHYGRTAQWYATKAGEDAKRLLEKSAMILIDLDKAIEYGIAKGANDIDKVLKRDVSEEDIDSIDGEYENDAEDSE